MKQKLTRLSQRYLVALRKHVQPGARDGLQSALRLGRQAVALGLETLGLARIHERAVTKLELAASKNGFIKKAEIFFAEALVPIVQKHRTARQTQVQLDKLTATLGRRTEELAVSNRQVAQRRRPAQGHGRCLRRTGAAPSKSAEESLELQKRLRQLTHRVIVVQEDERKKSACELQDEIAQTLLGINVRLLSLKQQARNSTKGFKNEIASTQRLVVESARSVRRVAREIGYRPQCVR
jgi:signal transduction histidine kinase